MAAPDQSTLEARVHRVIEHVLDVSARDPKLIDLHTRARTVFDRAEARAGELEHLPTSDIVVVN
jgi:hypothetical protein